MNDSARTRFVEPAARAGKATRYRWAAGGGLLLVAAMIVLQFTNGQAVNNRLDDAEVSWQNAAEVTQRLAEQVRALGGTPVAEPVPGPAGDAGAQGIPGRDGRDGRDGIPGVPGVGATGATGSAGAAGRDGRDATQGAAGRDGADGSSPPCLSEPAQCRGEDGTDGTDGEDGADGQPPSGWTTTYQNGSTETCTRAPGFNPDDPQYICTVSKPGHGDHATAGSNR